MSLPLHSEIDPKYTWNAPSLFASQADWGKACDQMADGLASLGRYQGRLSEGPATLLAAFEARDELLGRIGKVLTYAHMSRAVDNTDQAATAMSSKATGLHSQVLAGQSFIEPELIALGQATLRRWQTEARDVAFVVGGADGLDEPVLARSDLVLSLSALTLPHELARLVLALLLFGSGGGRSGGGGLGGGAHLVQEAPVDLVDDLQVPRQHVPEQRDGPALQGLAQDGVVGVGEAARGDAPGRLPALAGFVGVDALITRVIGWQAAHIAGALNIILAAQWIDARAQPAEIARQ